jgi:hypothetical protein
LSSNKANPILTVEASDADLGENSQISYSINSVYDLLEINSKTGQIYASLSFDEARAKHFWDKHKSSDNDLVVLFDVVASDSGKPKQSSILSISLHFVPTLANIYFKQTYYYFRIAESIELNKKFGQVNSVSYFNNDAKMISNIVYSIVDGDLYDEFQIDYQTGALSARTELDYEEKPTYYLTIKAFDLNHEQYTNATVRIDLIDINDNEPQFDKFEYKIEINENISKMTEIFRLNATDADSPNSTNSQIRYKLLNKFDKFYINEVTGIVYNKITFDYEATKSEGDQNTQTDQLYSSELFESNSYLPSNSIQLKIVAYDLGNLPVSLGNNQTYVGKSLETTCLLTVYNTFLNENPPQFEKSVYLSQIEIDEVNSRSNMSILSLLLDNSTYKTNKGALQFVTKVNAKDIDSESLIYSITKQSHEINYKIITFMLPGVYYFNIKLKVNANKSQDVIDSLQFKLIIVPPNSLLKNSSKQVYYYFKFDKEFYKFKSDGLDLGDLKLVNRYQNLKPTSKLYNLNIVPKLNNFRVKYKLVEKKFDLN